MNRAFELPLRLIIWHYRQGLADYLGVWRDLMWASARVFSFRDLLSTLLSPWRRIQESRDTLHGSFFERFAGAIMANTVSRAVGFFVRATFLLLGALVMILEVLIGLLGFLFWLVLPGVLVLFPIVGLTLLFL